MTGKREHKMWMLRLASALLYDVMVLHSVLRPARQCGLVQPWTMTHGCLGLYGKLLSLPKQYIRAIHRRYSCMNVHVHACV